MLFVTSARLAWSQGFENLDFESATVVLAYPPLSSYIYASSGIPGWTAYLDENPQGIIGYDTVSAGGASIFLEDTNSSGPLPLQGEYSIFLEGEYNPNGVPGNPNNATISQTGQIPATAQSLTFYGNLFGNIQVTFNGNNLSFSAIGNGANYTIYGVDISAYAGQTGQLQFTAFSGAEFTTGSALLDNIQFSTAAVPEPSAFALTALGGLLLGFRRRRILSACTLMGKFF